MTTPNFKLLTTIIFIAVFSASLGLDQSTKYHAQRDLLSWEHDTEIHNYQGKLIPIWASGEVRPDQSYIKLNLHYARNTGSAWSLGGDIDEAYRLPFFHTVTGACILLIFWMLVQTPLNQYAARLAYVMVLGGAIGNFVDRVRLGYVIDWVDVDWNLFGWFYDYPVFNVADMSIVGGLMVLTYDMFVLEKRRNNKKENSVTEKEAIENV